MPYFLGWVFLIFIIEIHKEEGIEDKEVFCFTDGEMPLVEGERVISAWVFWLIKVNSLFNNHFIKVKENTFYLNKEKHLKC